MFAKVVLLKTEIIMEIYEEENSQNKEIFNENNTNVVELYNDFLNWNF